jgi:Domain of unknown function (DUF4389)
MHCMGFLPPHSCLDIPGKAEELRPCIPTVPQSYSRFWAIPVLGLLVKWVILIPHFLVLGVLGLVVGILQFVLWVPVLFAGQFPQWGYGFVAGCVRWNTRVMAYALGVTDQYPPFALD